ncbi:hypothetical protein BGX28_001777, partial [Mortierella sp. GBA30]
QEPAQDGPYLVHGAAFRFVLRRELVAIFWQSSALKLELQRLARPSFPDLTAKENPSRDDVADIWLSNTTPGFLIKRLLSDVAKVGLTPRKLGKAAYKGNYRLLSVEEMREHLRTIREADFDPQLYQKRGYAGSIRMDDFRLQLVAFKLRELNMVKYRRPPEDRLPTRISTTVRGDDYYLTEIRNVVKSPQDVPSLWPNCRPEDIKVLELDGGQVCVVGAYLPKADATKESEYQGCQMDVDVPDMDKDDNITVEDLRGVTTSLVLAPASVTPTDPAPEKALYHNLA